MSRRFFRSNVKRGLTVRSVSLVLAVLTLELASRSFGPGGIPGQARFDPELGYLMQPDLKEIVTNGESGVTYELTTNSLGFRGPEWTVPKPRGVKRIAVLGDSFVEARSYEEHRIFCGRLEQLLNDASDGERWEIMNLGMAGHNTASQLALYDTIAKRLEPDYVLVCITLSNDIRDNLPEIAHGDAVYCEFSDDGKMTVIPPLREEDREIMSRSKFYVWQKEKVQFLINRFRHLNAIAEVVDPLTNTRRKKIAEAKWLTSIPLDERYERAWVHTERILKTFREHVTRDGSRLVVVSIPNAWQIHEELFDRMRLAQENPESFEIDRPIDRIASICDRLKIPIVELTFPFREDYAAHPEEHGLEQTSDLLFLNGIGHFTAHAHEIAAREIFEFFRSRESGTLDRRIEAIARDPQSPLSRD